MPLNIRSLELQSFRYAPVSQEEDICLYSCSDQTDVEHGEDYSTGTSEYSARTARARKSEPHGRSCMQFFVMSSAFVAMVILAVIAVDKDLAPMRPAHATHSQDGLVGLASDTKGLTATVQTSTIQSTSTPPGPGPGAPLPTKKPKNAIASAWNRVKQFFTPPTPTRVGSRPMTNSQLPWWPVSSPSVAPKPQPAPYQGFCRWGSGQRQWMRTNTNRKKPKNLDACKKLCQQEPRCNAYAWALDPKNPKPCDLYAGGPYTFGDGSPNSRCYILNVPNAVKKLQTAARKGDSSLPDPSWLDGFQVGQKVVIDASTSTEELNQVVGFGAGLRSLMLRYPLKFDHAAGSVISSRSQAPNSSAAKQMVKKNPASAKNTTTTTTTTNWSRKKIERKDIKNIVQFMFDH